MTQGAPRARSISSLTVDEALRMFTAASARLERHTDLLNAINVFPVPDGDTGTNMHLTMRSIMEEAAKVRLRTTPEVIRSMAQGALMGARGNSGVILSQIFSGLAEAVESAGYLSGRSLAAGLQQGATAAYKAVTQPREGTMLTVAREAATAATDASLDGDVRKVLTAAVEAARESLARTPEMLPVLKEAGVVDAGGQGLCLLLEGALSDLTGEDLPMIDTIALPMVERDWLFTRTHLQEAGEVRYGYCTEFLIHGPRASLNEIRRYLEGLGDSIVVVGNAATARVHLHTDSPDDAISYGRAQGSVAQVKVDDIQEQAATFFVRQSERSEQISSTISIVAVASGDGFVDVFRSLGASAVIRGGQTMNPSVKQIYTAIESCPASNVIILPNNKNIVASAGQAANLTDKQTSLVHTVTLVQGIAALLAFNPIEDMENNSRTMEEARSRIKTVEITRAVRSTTVSGVAVQKGQCIAVCDGKLILAEISPEQAAYEAIASLNEGVNLITIYYGKDVECPQAEALAQRFRAAYRDIEVEVVDGGQPHYEYIISLE